MGFVECHGTNKSRNKHDEAFYYCLSANNNAIGERLEKLNEILAKLPQDLGANLYKSFISFASHVAKSSGGVLGFFSVSEAEKSVIDLTMIAPIEFPEEA